MSDATFGLKIGVEGEREFKKALTEINREMRVLGSEMKLVASQFGKNETSAASLTAKNAQLAKEVEAHRNKVETLKAALENSAQSFGENDARTKNWQIQLNNATATLNDLEKELEEGTKALDALGDESGDTEGELKDAAQGADKLTSEVDQLGTELDEGAKKTSIFGDVLKANLASELIIGGIKAIGSAIAGISKGMAGIIKDGIDYNAQMEQYTTSFTTMLGDQAKAQELVLHLKKEAATTPFGMEHLAKNTQTLMAFGISAEEAKVRLTQLGDISQGDAQKLESLTLAFAQMSSTGKLTGQDLNQMINAGFNPLEEISRQTGKSIGELKDEMGKGAISADMVADAFASATAEGGRFYGAMEAQSKTFSGQMATLEDDVANLKGLLAGGVTEMLATSVLPMVNGWVGQLTEAMEADGIPGVIAAFDRIIKEALAFIAEQLPMVLDTGMQIMTALLNGLISALPEVAKSAVMLVTTLLEALIGVLPNLLTAAVQVVTTLATGIGEALPELIPTAVAAIVALVQGLVDSLPLILEAALTLVMGLATGIIDALPVLIEALPAILIGIVEFIATGIPMIINAGIELLTALVTALPEIIVQIVAVLPEIIMAIVTNLYSMIPQLIEAGVKLITSLVGALPTIIQTIVAAMPVIIAAVLNAIANSIPQLVQAGIQLLTALVGALPQIIVTVVAAIPQILMAIVNAIAQGVPQLIDAGVNLVRGLWQGIQQMAGWLWDQVAGFCQGIWDGITGYFGINSPSKEMAWVGDMLTRGLAGGITETGQRAIDAATDLAEETFGEFQNLSTGVEIPLTPVAADADLLTPPSLDRQTLGFDLEGIVSATSRAVLEGLQIQVVLDDGTLVGKLAPRFDVQLGRLNQHAQLFTGGAF